MCLCRAIISSGFIHRSPVHLRHSPPYPFCSFLTPPLPATANAPGLQRQLRACLTHRKTGIYVKGPEWGTFKFFPMGCLDPGLAVGVQLFFLDIAIRYKIVTTAAIDKNFVSAFGRALSSLSRDIPNFATRMSCHGLHNLIRESRDTRPGSILRMVCERSSLTTFLCLLQCPHCGRHAAPDTYSAETITGKSAHSINRVDALSPFSSSFCVPCSVFLSS